MTLIRDVGLSLKKLLQNKISEFSQENSIIFESPADIDATASPRLSIFIYHVAENAYLKNVEGMIDDTDMMARPSLNLDLFYIFVPYHQNREIELMLLERVMQVFHDNSVLRGSMLEGSLKGSGNDEIRIISNNLKFEDILKIWERFPNKAYKICVSYILTPVRIPSEEKPIKIVKVKEKDLRVHTMYVFCWNDVPGKDNDILREFLKQNYGVSWIKTANIEKTDSGKTIKIYSANNILYLGLNDEKNKVNLRINDDRTDEFYVRIEDSKLNIYYTMKSVRQ